ncbi:hypothetical protein [Candidatus Vidania fulgoroideorum]
MNISDIYKRILKKNKTINLSLNIKKKKNIKLYKYIKLPIPLKNRKIKAIILNNKEKTSKYYENKLYSLNIEDKNLYKKIKLSKVKFIICKYKAYKHLIKKKDNFLNKIKVSRDIGNIFEDKSYLEDIMLGKFVIIRESCNSINTAIATYHLTEKEIVKNIECILGYIKINLPYFIIKNIYLSNNNSKSYKIILNEKKNV